METRAPTFGQIAIAVTFALSCFALLLFLWTAFGGPAPLGPKGYRFEVPVKEGTTLANESDVRISGVSVGKVKEIKTGPDNDAIATVEMDAAYAPIPADTRATLRQKTLLGETYVELTPGSSDSPDLPEGGKLASAQVGDTVQLDEIFRTFDARTRAAFQSWMQGAAVATTGRGADLSAAIGNLEPFASDATRVLRVLDSQDAAVSRLVSNTGQVFGAISERRGQLRGLVQNADTVFHTTAVRNADLEATFRTLPTFLDESNKTLTRVNEFAATTQPLVTQLRPAARRLSPVLGDLGKAAPDLRRTFNGLRKLAPRSTTGLAALRQILGTDLPPVLGALDPFTNQLQPIVESLAPYKHEITAFLGNVTAATQAFNTTPESNFAPVHYLRTITPIDPTAVAAFPTRLETNRSNPYVAPGGYANVGSPSLQSFSTTQCGGGGAVAKLNPADAVTFPGGADLFNRIQQYAFDGETTTSSVPTAPCNQQGPFSSLGALSENSRYWHVYQRDP